MTVESQESHSTGSFLEFFQPEAPRRILDPAVPVALATLGVLVGLGIGLDRRGDRRLLIAANLESGLTMLAVAAAGRPVAPNIMRAWTYRYIANSPHSAT